MISDIQNPIGQNQVALVFDFDGTVTPDVMLMPIFHWLGIDAEEFWDHTAQLVSQGYDRELAYLHSLSTIAKNKDLRLSNQEIRSLGRELYFYPGFPEILDDLKDSCFVFNHTLETYVITAGLEEMVLGSVVGPYLKKCWGCKYSESSEGTIGHPMQIITSANKVEKLYLIKRQLLTHEDSYKVNLVDPKDDIVPWDKLIYVADGATDVPAFEVVRRGGGHTIAVFNPKTGVSEEPMIRGRTHDTLPADYSEGSLLNKTLTQAIMKCVSS